MSTEWSELFIDDHAGRVIYMRFNYAVTQTVHVNRAEDIQELKPKGCAQRFLNSEWNKQRIKDKQKKNNSSVNV